MCGMLGCQSLGGKTPMDNQFSSDNSSPAFVRHIVRCSPRYSRLNGHLISTAHDERGGCSNGIEISLQVNPEVCLAAEADFRHVFLPCF